MIDRRGVIQAVIGAVYGLFAGKMAPEKPDAADPSGAKFQFDAGLHDMLMKSKRLYKRIFRYSPEAAAWQEIRWEDMRPGDRVISLGDWADCLQIQAFEVAGNPTVTGEPDANGNPLGVVQTSGTTFDLLPSIWGTPREKGPPVRDARTINVPPDFMAGDDKVMNPPDREAFARSFGPTAVVDVIVEDASEPPAGVWGAYEEVAL